MVLISPRNNEWHHLDGLNMKIKCVAGFYRQHAILSSIHIRFCQ